MLTAPTIHQLIDWFTGVRTLMLAVMVAAVAVGWQVGVADADEDDATAFTVCSDTQNRIRIAGDAEECNANEEFIELDLVTKQALANTTADLEARVDELETNLQGQIDELEQTVDNQAAKIEELEDRVAELEDSENGDTGDNDLGARVTGLEELLNGVSRDEIDGHETLRFAGMNVQIVNDHEDEFTDTANGVGNLIIGYNEKGFGEPDRDGSHNLVIGIRHNYPASGGLVVGQQNTISGDFASVSGGIDNTASGGNASVSGGRQNTAEGQNASVSGGSQNISSGVLTSISGGVGNTAIAPQSSVSGGLRNTASGPVASVSGGEGNEASGSRSSILGGQGVTVEDQFGIYPDLE